MGVKEQPDNDRRTKTSLMKRGPATPQVDLPPAATPERDVQLPRPPSKPPSVALSTQPVPRSGPPPTELLGRECVAEAVPKKMPRSKGKGKGKASSLAETLDERCVAADEEQRGERKGVMASTRKQTITGQTSDSNADAPVKAAIEKANEETWVGRRCPGNCGFQVTWHETHCCKKCVDYPGRHGKKCDRRPFLEAVCSTPGCRRRPYDRNLKHACCRTCLSSGGRSHGKGCDEKQQLANPEASGSIANSLEDRDALKATKSDALLNLKNSSVIEKPVVRQHAVPKRRPLSAAQKSDCKGSSLPSSADSAQNSLPPESQLLMAPCTPPGSPSPQPSETRSIDKGSRKSTQRPRPKGTIVRCMEPKPRGSIARCMEKAREYDQKVLSDQQTGELVRPVSLDYGSWKDKGGSTDASAIAHEATDDIAEVEMADAHGNFSADATYGEKTVNDSFLDQGVDDDGDDVWRESDFEQSWEDQNESQATRNDLTSDRGHLLDSEYALQAGSSVEIGEGVVKHEDLEFATDMISAIAEGILDIKDVRKAEEDADMASLQGRLEALLENQEVTIYDPSANERTDDESVLIAPNMLETGTSDEHEKQCQSIGGQEIANDTSEQSMCIVAEKVLANLADLTLLASERSDSSDQTMERIHNALIGASEGSMASAITSPCDQTSASTGVGALDLLSSISGYPPPSEAVSICDSVPPMSIEPVSAPHLHSSTSSRDARRSKTPSDSTSKSTSSGHSNKTRKRSRKRSASSSSSSRKPRKKSRTKANSRSRSRNDKKTTRNTGSKKTKAENKKECSGSRNKRVRKDVGKRSHRGREKKGHSSSSSTSSTSERESSASTARSQKRISNKVEASTAVVAQKVVSKQETLQTRELLTIYKSSFVPSTAVETSKRHDTGIDDKSPFRGGSNISAIVQGDTEVASKPQKVTVIAYYFMEKNRGVEQRRWPLLVGRSYTIGQQESADIRLQYTRISRLHCSIVLQGDGRCASVVVTDLKSTNGTSILPGIGMDEQKLRKGESQTLHFKTGLEIKLPLDDSAYTFEVVREKERQRIRKGSVDL